MKLLRPLLLALFALLLGSAVAGCGPGFTLNVPEDFVVLEEDNRSYAQRATNAHGVVLAVREIDNEVHGSRDFWAEAVRQRLRVAHGYALVEESEAQAASGDRGLLMRFGRDEGSRPYLFWLALFVTEDKVFIVEAGGERERFEESRESIEGAIAGFRVH
jgi:hypothetical protein